MIMLPSFFQISPVAGGIIAGLLHTILGPDHLCTIVTLSACQGAEAFWFGVRWAGGHLTGMAVIGMIFGLLNVLQISAFNFELYEHYAYYVVGFMLMFMGGYFILFADKYFDAEWAPKQASCACHAHSESPIAPDRHVASNYGSGDTEEIHKGHNHTDMLKGMQPITGSRQTGSVLVGFAQGVACPAGVVGMVFLKQYSPLETVIFIAIFFTVTTLAMGLLAMTYGILTQRCVSSKVLGRSIYYASCGLSLTFGAAWIYLNATHRLDAMLGHNHDHGHDHGHGDHHGHHHHSHDHVHGFLQQEDGRLSDLLSLSR